MALAGQGQSASALRLMPRPSNGYTPVGCTASRFRSGRAICVGHILAREQLGPEAVAELEDEGRAISFDAAIDQVLGVGQD